MLAIPDQRQPARGFLRVRSYSHTPIGAQRCWERGLRLAIGKQARNTSHGQALHPSTALRILVVGLAVWGAIEVIEIPGGSFNGDIFSIDGVFFWQRVLFGLLGPVVLAYMTWETAKIQSTQSATGILYVDFFTVIVGEVLAKYLLVATTVPL